MPRAAVYCEKGRAKQSSFDQASFRWITNGDSRVLIGCPKGYWDSKRNTCRVGTRAYKTLTPAKRGRRCDGDLVLKPLRGTR